MDTLSRVKELPHQLLTRMTSSSSSSNPHSNPVSGGSTNTTSSTATGSVVTTNSRSVTTSSSLVTNTGPCASANDYQTTGPMMRHMGKQIPQSATNGSGGGNGGGNNPAERGSCTLPRSQVLQRRLIMIANSNELYGSNGIPIGTPPPTAAPPPIPTQSPPAMVTAGNNTGNQQQQPQQQSATAPSSQPSPPQGVYCLSGQDYDADSSPGGGGGGGNSSGYHFGSISRETAEQILFDLGCVDGLFLVRDSTATDSVLSLCHNQSILHYRISRIPSTGQVILHGTPIQVFPDFDTLILKVQGLAIKPLIPCDRHHVTSLYGLTGGGGGGANGDQTLLYRVSAVSPPSGVVGGGGGGGGGFFATINPGSFYGTHIHYHQQSGNNRTIGHSHGGTGNHPLPVGHNQMTLGHQHHLNALNSRSSSMWKLPLPEIKEAIIKKTKELGDDLVYDTGVGGIIQPPPVTKDVTKGIELTATHENDLMSTSPITLHTVKNESSDFNTTNPCKQLCDVCGLKVIVSTGVKDNGPSDGTTLNRILRDPHPGPVSTGDSGLECVSCKRPRHFACDSLSKKQFILFTHMVHRFTCTHCLSHGWKAPSSPSLLMPTPITPPPNMTCIENKENPLKDMDAVIPSKEEMKQMIKEVVDDVIRSTITQVMQDTTHHPGVPSMPFGLSLPPMGPMGSMGPIPFPNALHINNSHHHNSHLKSLPSVTTLDKAAEEEARTALQEHDLLMLLKSPDVEVKHFSPFNSNGTIASGVKSILKKNPLNPNSPLSIAPPIISQSAPQPQPPVNPIISDEEIELKKRQMLMESGMKHKPKVIPTTMTTSIAPMNVPVAPSVKQIEINKEDVPSCPSCPQEIRSSTLSLFPPPPSASQLMEVTSTSTSNESDSKGELPLPPPPPPPPLPSTSPPSSSSKEATSPSGEDNKLQTSDDSKGKEDDGHYDTIQFKREHVAPKVTEDDGDGDGDGPLYGNQSQVQAYLKLFQQQQQHHQKEKAKEMFKRETSSRPTGT